MTHKHLSMFTGVGGLDMAVEEVLQAETILVSDIDKGANKILAHRYPHAENLGDVSLIDFTKYRGIIKSISAGFPCQDISHAGLQAGLGGARSGLWSEVHRAIKEIQPEYAIIENVKGLLSAKTAHSEDVESVGPKGGRRVGRTNRALGVILGDLADIGYDAVWRGVRASEVGAPHRRERIFILATPANANG